MVMIAVGKGTTGTCQQNKRLKQHFSSGRLTGLGTDSNASREKRRVEEFHNRRPAEQISCNWKSSAKLSQASFHLPFDELSVHWCGEIWDRAYLPICRNSTGRLSRALLPVT